MPESSHFFATDNGGMGQDASSIIPEEFRSVLEPALQEYKERSKVFFDALFLLGEKGWERQQFEVLRDNYFYRTRTTASSVARVVVSALSNTPPDIRTASEVTRLNLLDEVGSGNYSDSHISQLEESFSIHGQVCFDLPPVSVQSSDSSLLVLDAARKFREQQFEAYTHKSYLHVLGASVAQEFAAFELISSLYNNIFIVSQDQYSPLLWGKASRYFKSHLDGTEIGHARLAFGAVQRNVVSEADANLFVDGWAFFLFSQSRLWHDLAAAFFAKSDCKAE